MLRLPKRLLVAGAWDEEALRLPNGVLDPVFAAAVFMLLKMGLV